MIGKIKANSVTSDQANRVLSTRTVQGSIRPNDRSMGVKATELFRVQYDRTVTSKGFNRSNDLGFTASERLTNINKELT